METNSDIIIRRLAKADLDQILEIEKEAFLTPWPREFFEQEAENKAAYYIVMERLGEIIAYGGTWLSVFEGHITNIAVKKEYRRRGLGKALVSNILSYLKSVSIPFAVLEVRSNNKAAQELYRSLGFKYYKKVPGYYEDSGEDAFLYMCELSRIK